MRSVRRSVGAGLAVLLLLGCSDDKGASQPATRGKPAARQAKATGCGPDEEAARPGEKEPPARSPIGVIQPGKPGAIKGALESPYVRLAVGVVVVKKAEGVEFKPPAMDPVMDQRDKIFRPHVLPLLVGSTADFPSTDDVRHSVYTRKGSSNDFNLGQYDAGVVKRVEFDHVGITRLGCNVHAEMSAYVVACQNPFFSLTSKRDGSFEIADVPPGRYELTSFHERIKEASIEVEVRPGETAQAVFPRKMLKRR